SAHRSTREAAPGLPNRAAPQAGEGRQHQLEKTAAVPPVLRLRRRVRGGFGRRSGTRRRDRRGGAFPGIPALPRQEVLPSGGSGGVGVLRRDRGGSSREPALDGER